jgi:predicted nucleic acid-binding protein
MEFKGSKTEKNLLAAFAGESQARKGVAIGSHDLMIGATCISLGFSVVTPDFRDFEKIPGLKIERIIF